MTIKISDFSFILINCAATFIYFNFKFNLIIQFSSAQDPWSGKPCNGPYDTPEPKFNIFIENSLSIWGLQNLKTSSPLHDEHLLKAKLQKRVALNFSSFWRHTDVQSRDCLSKRSTFNVSFIPQQFKDTFKCAALYDQIEQTDTFCAVSRAHPSQQTDTDTHSY